MRQHIRFTCDQVRPKPADVLRRMQMPSDAAVPPRLQGLIDGARSAFDTTACPVAVFETVSAGAFLDLHANAIGSAEQTPLQQIVPCAAALALFAATLGPAVDSTIRELFAAGDAPSGWALDAFASAAAERLAERVAQEYLAAIGQSRPTAGLAVLPYSPGYCGWDVSGQAALFRQLSPIEIGVTLSARCLMQPIKSVSGVLVAAAPEVHCFRPSFSFCEPCITKDCRRRMASLRRPA